MEAQKGDAVQTRARILEAARRLFAERDMSSVSIRDIAEAAQVSHGLVQRYFGSREQMVEGIIREEIEAYAARPLVWPNGSGVSAEERRDFRERLKAGLPQFHDFAALIVRAELGGVNPGRMLDPSTPTPARQLAEAIEAHRAEGSRRVGMDPRMVSAYVNAALFAFSTMAPWLMASVGLTPDEYEARLDEILEISVDLIALAAGEAPIPGQMQA